MSDLLTHWAVLEDCRRLIPFDREIEPYFKTVIEAEQEYARLGAITRNGNQFMEPVLRWAKDHWDEKDDASFGRKVAFVLGGLTHQACDRMMKPLIRKGGDYLGRREISAYYDTHVFRQVYLSGREEPFNQFLLADNATNSGQALEAFVRSLFQRALLSSHTIKPDLNNIDSWLNTLFAMVQELHVDVNLYVSVFQRPDPMKMQQYGVETLFYRAEDPAISVARALQHGEQVNSKEAREAVLHEANQSHYAKALTLSLSYLRNASAFWCGDYNSLVSPNLPKDAV